MNEEILKKIEELQNQVFELKDQLKNDHGHDGLDFSRVKWSDIDNRVFHIFHTVPGINAAIDTQYGEFFIVPFPCVVTGFKEVHQVVGSDAGDVTLQLEKLTGVEAPDGGAELLIDDISLKATAETVQNGSITDERADKTLSIDDRLCLKDAGTLTAAENVSVIITLNML